MHRPIWAFVSLTFLITLSHGGRCKCISRKISFLTGQVSSVARLKFFWATNRGGLILSNWCIEHFIIGKTLFIPHSAVLSAFYNNDKNILFFDMKQANCQKMSKLNCFYNAEKILFVDKCFINEGDNVLKVSLSIQIV